MRVLVLLAPLAVFACRSGPEAGVEVRVAVAASLRDAFGEIASAFERASPGVRVVASFVSSGAGAQQIRQGAPYDLFFSADVGFARGLDEAGLAEPGTVRVYARGGLALWIPYRVGLEPADLSVLADPRVRRIAVAQPGTAPYGRAAVQALRSAGLHDAVASRLVYGEDVAQAAQQAVVAADAAFVSRSYARTPALRGRGRALEVPADLYDPIDQACAIVRGRDRPEVRAFYDFVAGAEGRRILESWGYDVP